MWVPGFSGGESETLIGEWLKQRGRRDDVIISTKVGLLPGTGGKGLNPARIAAAVDESLQRLQTDYIDVYFAHVDDKETPIEEALHAFDKLVKAGKVRVLGASQYTAERIGEALQVAEAKGYEPFRVLQPELNLVNREAYLGPVQDLAIAENLGVITYFSLAAGFLTGKYRSKDDLRGRPRGIRVKGYLNDEGLRVLNTLDTVVAETGETHSRIALAWAMAQPGVTAPIASATSLEQLQDLMGAADVKLTPDQLARLDGALAEPA